jgi:hypothetical protein
VVVVAADVVVDPDRVDVVEPPPPPPPPEPPSQAPGLATHSAPPVRAPLMLSESMKIPPTSSSAMIATITA